MFKPGWRNWQTRQIQDLVSHGCEGSTPSSGTMHQNPLILSGALFLCSSSSFIDLGIITQRVKKNGKWVKIPKNKVALDIEVQAGWRVYDILNQKIIDEKRFIDRKKIDELVIKRNEARSNKDFELADKIRDQLNKMNIEIEDTPDGTIWKINK